MKGTRFEAVSSIQHTVTRVLKAIWEEAFSHAFDSLFVMMLNLLMESLALVMVSSRMEDMIYNDTA
jgi:hypothetical protein